MRLFVVAEAMRYLSKFAHPVDAAAGENLDVSDRAIDSHIKNLRRKLAASLPGEELIQSVYGLGYRVEP